MKMICSHRVNYKGRCYKPGAIVEISAEEANTDIVLSSFVGPEAAAESGLDAIPQKGDSSLTVNELKRRLDEMGVAYSARAAKPELADLYAKQFAQK